MNNSRKMSLCLPGGNSLSNGPETRVVGGSGIDPEVAARRFQRDKGQDLGQEEGEEQFISDLVSSALDLAGIDLESQNVVDGSPRSGLREPDEAGPSGVTSFGWSQLDASFDTELETNQPDSGANQNPETMLDISSPEDSAWVSSEADLRQRPRVFGRLAASERMLQQRTAKKTTERHRWRSAGDIARAVLHSVSRPFRRRHRPTEDNESCVSGGTKTTEKGESTRLYHKPLADPSSKHHPTPETRTKTKGFAKGPVKTQHKGIFTLNDQAGTVGEKSTQVTKEIGQEEVPLQETDPIHRPLLRTRTQRMLHGVGQSLTRIGRPLVACFIRV